MTRLTWLETAFSRVQRMASIGCWELDLSNLDDVNSNRLVWSDGCFPLFGYAPGEVEVTNALFFEAVHPEDRPRIAEAVGEALRTLKPYVIEHRIRRRDGEERWLLEHADVVCDPVTRRPRSLFGTAQDVTERARAERALRESQAFSYAIAHDLRAPMRAVRVMAEMLERRLPAGLPEADRELLGMIGDSGRRGDDIIRDVLALSRLSTEPVPRVPVDLDALFRALRRLYPEWDESRVRVRAPLGSVMGSESLLSQIATNLVSNGLKFAAPGREATVEARTERRGELVRLSFEDTGVGLDAAERGRLFQPFVRLHAGVEGTGIGLTIVRKAAERLGGRVGVDSKKGVGSTFWVELPAA